MATLPSRVRGIDRWSLVWVLLLVAYPVHWYVDFGLGRFNVSLGDVVVVAVLMAWGCGRIGPRTVPVYVLPLAGFVVASGYSIVIASYLSPGYLDLAAYASDMLKYLGAFAWLLSVYVVGRRVSRRALYRGLAVAVAVATIVGLLTIVATLVLGQQRPSGPFQNPNIFANYLLLHLAAHLYLGPYYAAVDTRLAIGRHAVPPVVVVAIANTGSRGALIGLAAFAVLGTAVYVRRHRLPVLGLVSVGAVVVGALVAMWHLNPWLFTNRLLSDRNISVRLELWEAALEAFVTSPVLGIGIGQLRPFMMEMIGLDRSVHNSIIAVATEAGLIGLALFAVLIWLLVRDGFRSESIGPAVMVCFVLATVAQGATATNVETFRSVWIAVGLVSVTQAKRIDRTDVVSWRSLARSWWRPDRPVG